MRYGKLIPALTVTKFAIKLQFSYYGEFYDKKMLNNNVTKKCIVFWLRIGSSVTSTSCVLWSH